jgi:hypothetical protein
MKRVVFVVRISGQTSIPIISFRTQLPILHALAQITVLEAYAEDSIQKFGEFNSAPAVQGGIAATSKAVLCQASQPMFHALSERCGAQGLYAYNHIIESRLAWSQLQKRYTSTKYKYIISLSLLCFPQT